MQCPGNDKTGAGTCADCGLYYQPRHLVHTFPYTATRWQRPLISSGCFL